jgi:hypothetical protein
MSGDFTMPDSGFPAEFAAFVDFIDGLELHEAVSRVASKLNPLSSPVRALYRDRYFFHEHCISITEGPTPFQLDVSNINAVRAASFIAGINRVRRRLSPVAIPRFRNVIVGCLRPDRDIRQLEHEIRSFVHFGQKGMQITLADLEGHGRFDLDCRTKDTAFEVECKTVTQDTGAAIKTDLLVNLSEEFRRTVHRTPVTFGSGIFILTFCRAPDECRDLALTLRTALGSSSLPESPDGDFDLVFIPKPEWTKLVTSATPNEVRAALRDELIDASDHHFATKIGDKIIALALRPHKPNSLSEKVISVLKEGADQCSGNHPSLVWLHLIGHAEAEFLKLAHFSMEGGGAGLNAIVAKALHPRASSTDRSHVHTIRFSAEAAEIIQKPVLDEELLIRKARSLSGPCYDVPNPLCRFKGEIDF